MKKALWVAALVAVGACSSLKPLPIRAGDSCFRCRRTIEDVKRAAEMIDSSRMALPFRSAGCVAKYLIDHPEETPRAVFVTDYATGKLVSAQSALFVPVMLDDKTGERDYLAFASQQDATAFAHRHDTITVNWRGVMAQAHVSEVSN